MQPNEGERLGRIEEQVIAVRTDIGRMENSLAAATKIFSEMHLSYVPRNEHEQIERNRDKDASDQDKQIANLWKKRNDDRGEIERLHRKWAWLTGLGSMALIALGAVEAVIRGMVHKP